MRLVSMCFHRRVAAFATSLAALLFALLFPHRADAEDPLLLSIYTSDITKYFDAQVVDDIVYMAGFVFFHVIDVSDPTQPIQLALLGGSGDPAGVEVVGDRAYLSQYSPNHLEVVSVANPAAPVSLGGYSVPGSSYGLNVEVVGDVVYLVADPGGLRILDVSALPSIVELGSFSPPETLSSVAVSGSHAYVASRAAGLFIVDISDPTMPDYVGTIAGSVSAVEVVGTHLYVGGDEFRIFDVSSSGSPVLVGQAAIEFETHKLRVNEAEGLAYAGGHVIDVSDVAKPVLAVTLSIPFPFPVGIGGSDGIDGIVYAPHPILGLHVYRVFLPEPSTVLLQLTGVGVLAVLKRRRGRRLAAT